MIHITEEDVRKNLDMKELISELGVAFQDYGKGDAESSTRNRIFTGSGFLNTMPAFWRRYDISGLKTYLGSAAGAKFVVIIFQESNIDEYYVIDADKLGQMRTGALPAMLTKKIVRKEDPNFLLIGSGYQAETQLLAMKEAYSLSEVYIYSKTLEHAQEFSRRMGKELGIRIKVENNVEDLSPFDIVNTITNSKEPIITGRSIPERIHLNLCGANLKFRREVSDEAMSMMDLVVVEHMEQARAESADTGIDTVSDRIVELKDFMLSPEFQGKRSAFKTMGIGLEDLVAAHTVLRKMGYLQDGK